MCVGIGGDLIALLKLVLLCMIQLRKKDGDYSYPLHETGHCSDYAISNLDAVNQLFLDQLTTLLFA